MKEEEKNQKVIDDKDGIDGIKELYKEFTKIQEDRDGMIEKFTEIKKQNNKLKVFIELYN
jgi:hypothetical protein